MTRHQIINGPTDAFFTIKCTLQNRISSILCEKYVVLLPELRALHAKID